MHVLVSRYLQLKMGELRSYFLHTAKINKKVLFYAQMDAKQFFYPHTVHRYSLLIMVFSPHYPLSYPQVRLFVSDGSPIVKTNRKKLSISAFYYIRKGSRHERCRIFAK